MVEFEADNLKEMPCQVGRQRYASRRMNQPGRMYLYDVRIDGSNYGIKSIYFEPMLKDPIMDGAGRVPVIARFIEVLFIIVQDWQGLLRMDRGKLRRSDQDVWWRKVSMNIVGIYYTETQTFMHQYCKIELLSVRSRREFYRVVPDDDPCIASMKAVLTTFLKKIQYNVHWIEFTSLNEVTP